MISTGNDIIALQLVNTERTLSKRFYAKILSGTEILLYRQLYANNIAFEKYVWLLWSVKESVYKFSKRCNPQLRFSPTKICLQQLSFPQRGDVIAREEASSFLQDECFCSQVSFGSAVFYTRSFITDELIFTVANNENDFQHIHWGVQPVSSDAYETQAEAVRSLTLNRLKKIFPESNFKIEKNTAGYPEILQQPGIKISFAHHGNFVAYSLTLG